jgi:hypothetical protein
MMGVILPLKVVLARPENPIEFAQKLQLQRVGYLKLLQLRNALTERLVRRTDAYRARHRQGRRVLPRIPGVALGQLHADLLPQLQLDEHLRHGKAG